MTARQHDLDLDTILTAARQGDRRALDLLLRTHATSIRKMCYRLGRDLDDVDDLVQETLLAIARNIGQFRAEAAFLTWVFTIARSCATRMRHRIARTPSPSANADRHASTSDTDLDDDMSINEVREAIGSALDALSPLDREVLSMRDFDGYSAAEVARSLGLTVAAVKSRLHRARYAVRTSVMPALAADHHPAFARNHAMVSARSSALRPAAT